MTTPTNRAPRFVLIEPSGATLTFSTEAGAREVADPHGTIHPIGDALPAPVPVKTMGQICEDAFRKCPGDDRASFAAAAAAVIAAHEASVRYEKVTRWAVRGRDGGWFGSDFCDAHKADRTLFAGRDYAADIARVLNGAGLVRITTRRRVRK